VNKTDALTFDRLISHPRPLWLTLGVSVLLLLAPVLAAYLDGALSNIIAQGGMRSLMVLPAILIYILIIGPPLDRLNSSVVTMLRPLVLIGDSDFAALVEQFSHTRTFNKILALAIGVAVGFWSASLSDLGTGFSWTKLYWYLFTCLVFGILGWVSYESIASTRLLAAVLRQPLRIDIFDTRPFEAIGRQSLVLALVFIGGIALSLFFSFNITSIQQISFWLVYLTILLVPIAIFFFNMRPTHRVLAAEKKRQVETIQSRIQQAFQAYFQRSDEKLEIGDLPAQVNTMLAYEQRLKETRTWPYNTAMLRTLFFSVFIPFAMVLLRLILEVII